MKEINKELFDSLIGKNIYLLLIVETNKLESYCPQSKYPTLTKFIKTQKINDKFGFILLASPLVTFIDTGEKSIAGRIYLDVKITSRKFIHIDLDTTLKIDELVEKDEKTFSKEIYDLEAIRPELNYVGISEALYPFFNEEKANKFIERVLNLIKKVKEENKETYSISLKSFFERINECKKNSKGEAQGNKNEFYLRNFLKDKIEKLSYHVETKESDFVDEDITKISNFISANLSPFDYLLIDNKNVTPDTELVFTFSYLVESSLDVVIKDKFDSYGVIEIVKNRNYDDVDSMIKVQLSLKLNRKTIELKDFNKVFKIGKLKKVEFSEI